MEVNYPEHAHSPVLKVPPLTNYDSSPPLLLFGTFREGEILSRGEDEVHEDAFMCMSQAN